MTLFEPYSHTRVVELRQEQLARKAKRRNQLRVDTLDLENPGAVATIISALAARLTRTEKRANRAAPAPKGRPALDS